MLSARIGVIQGDRIGRDVIPPGATMLEHLNTKDPADAVIDTIALSFASSENLTRDVVGAASTNALGRAVADTLSIHPLEACRHG